MLHTDSVFIYKNVAYVGTLDEQGNKIFERYVIKTTARRYIDALDQKGNDAVIPAGFTFHPPAKSHTLNYKIRHERRKPGDSRDSKKILGTGITRKPKEHYFSNLRSGTGMVQFIAGKLDSSKISTQKLKHGKI
jgi:hypothetical protein